MKRRDLLTVCGALLLPVAGRAAKAAPKPSTLTFRFQRVGPATSPYGKPGSPNPYHEDAEGHIWVCKRDPDTGEIVRVTRGLRCAKCSRRLGDYRKRAQDWFGGCEPIPVVGEPLGIGPFGGVLLCAQCAIDAAKWRKLGLGVVSVSCAYCGKRIADDGWIILSSDGSSTVWHPLCYERRER